MNPASSLRDQIVQCRKCPRLVAWREEVALKKKRAYLDCPYWGKPVPGFGDRDARVMVIGLAPGAHGSNRTGRMFTGDASGVFLYRALYKAGFANQADSTDPEDGLALRGMYITAVCRCVPPDNRPTPDEINNCLPFLTAEMNSFPRLEGVVVLGRIALDGYLKGLASGGRTVPAPDFVHGKVHRLGDGLPWLITSYHPSRQNTQTGRLTEVMFDGVWTTARTLLDG